jgi:hypothetical protein
MMVNGAGDITSAAFVALYLAHPNNLKAVLKGCADRIHSLLKFTLDSRKEKMLLIPGLQLMMNPSHSFEVEEVLPQAQEKKTLGSDTVQSLANSLQTVLAVSPGSAAAPSPKPFVQQHVIVTQTPDQLATITRIETDPNFRNVENGVLFCEGINSCAIEGSHYSHTNPLQHWYDVRRVVKFYDSEVEASALQIQRFMIRVNQSGVAHVFLSDDIKSGKTADALTTPTLDVFLKNQPQARPDGFVQTKLA